MVTKVVTDQGGGLQNRIKLVNNQGIPVGLKILTISGTHFQPPHTLMLGLKICEYLLSRGRHQTPFQHFNLGGNYGY